MHAGCDDRVPASAVFRIEFLRGRHTRSVPRLLPKPLCESRKATTRFLWLAQVSQGENSFEGHGDRGSLGSPPGGYDPAPRMGIYEPATPWRVGSSRAALPNPGRRTRLASRLPSASRRRSSGCDLFFAESRVKGARSSSSSRVLLPSAREMSSVASGRPTCGAILETALNEREPSCMAERSSGRLIAALAAWIRRYASPSLRRNRRKQ